MSARALFRVLCGLQVVDVIATAIGLTHGVVEWNPLIRCLIEAWGLPLAMTALGFFKAAACSVIWVRVDVPSMRPILACCVLYYAVACAGSWALVFLDSALLPV